MQEVDEGGEGEEDHEEMQTSRDEHMHEDDGEHGGEGNEHFHGRGGFHGGRGFRAGFGGFRGGFRGRGMLPPPGGFFNAPPQFRGRGGMPPFIRGGRGGFVPPPFMRGRGYPPRGFPPPRGGFNAFPHPTGYGTHPGQGPPAIPQVDPEERLKKLAGCSDGESLWVETETADGKKYYYHAVQRNTVWEKPENAKIIDQSQLAELIQKSQEEERREQEEQQQAFAERAANAGAFPPPGWGGGPPQAMGGGGAQNPDEAWNEFTAPDGRKYYYNSITQENTWEKPKALLEREQAGKVPEAAKANPEQSAAIIEAQQKAQAALQAYLAQKAAGPTTTENGKSSATTAEKKEDSKPKDPSRPVSSTPVAGTPWCVVWTGDNKVFFYNPSTKLSVWERPPEMYGRADVDALVSAPPVTKEEPKEIKKLEAGSETESSAEDGDDDDGGPPKKKSRSERKKEAAAAMLKKDKEKHHQSTDKSVVDPAIQAELEAQREREKLPLEDRLKQFKDMLHDKGVSTGSTFEKELSKIVFDSRYLLLSATERRACFEAYVREKTEVERAEKKKKAKESKNKFMELLKEAELHGRSSFSSFASKYAKDSRFKNVDKTRDREDMFNDFVGDLYKKEKEEKKMKKEKAKKDFLGLLGEQHGLTNKSKWSTVKKTMEDDERYKAVDSSSTREQLFKDYVEKLGDETLSDIEEEEDRKKRLNEQAAIAARQKEVEAELGDNIRERNKELEKQRILEHEDKFKAMLLDMVKSAESTWHEMRRLLRKDDRYSECDLLDKEKKEHLFDLHIRNLERKRRDAFFNVLDEHPKITVQTRWKDAKKMIQDEEDTFSKLVSNSERVGNSNIQRSVFIFQNQENSLKSKQFSHLK
ncbi:hypothetical protein WR25_00020 isoform B [Diploscapter pachys]|nr:hypothetical protein WR25_00020 isoform B [Diploscapter pachys]